MNVSATLDGKPLSAGVAWRGGFGDQSVSSAASLVEVFYSESGKIEYFNYKKLGIKDHQDQPAQVNGFMEAAGIEDTFFTAAFLPNQPGMTLWDWTQQQNVTEDGKTTQRPVAEMAAGPQTPGSWSTRLYVGPKHLTELGKIAAVADGLSAVWVHEHCGETTAADSDMDLQVHSQLWLGHCSADHRDQHGALSAEGEELAFDEENAESDAAH